MTHIITWDHAWCDHDAGDCWPRGSVECTDPTGDCRKHCRTMGYTSCEDGWIPCVNECDGYDHAYLDVEHCTNGHVLDLGECNAVLFLEEDLIANGPGSNPFTDARPIGVEWTGDGYQWWYVTPPGTEIA